MKEKFLSILKSMKLKEVSRKIFTQKKIRAAIAAVVLIAALKIGYSLAFEVNGTIMKVDTNSIVVSNFLGTRTVNTGNYPLDSSRIAVGQRVEITKNLSGDVISIRGAGGRGGFAKGEGRQMGRDGKVAQGQFKSGQIPQGQMLQGQNRKVQVPQGQGKADGTSGATANQNKVR